LTRSNAGKETGIRAREDAGERPDQHQGSGRVRGSLGYDDIEFAAPAAVPLSSVRQPRHQTGRTAAQLLLEEALGGGHEHREVIFQPELAVRQSSQARPSAGQPRGSRLPATGRPASRSGNPV
jgi:hypothetical protein